MFGIFIFIKMQRKSQKHSFMSHQDDHNKKQEEIVAIYYREIGSLLYCWWEYKTIWPPQKHFGDLLLSSTYNHHMTQQFYFCVCTSN